LACSEVHEAKQQTNGMDVDTDAACFVSNG
jgi:hypothetical protein